MVKLETVIVLMDILVPIAKPAIYSRLTRNGQKF